MPNKTAKGLVPISTDELYKCFIYCIIVDICEALAFDPKSKFPCWIHEGLSGSIKEEDLIPMEGSVVYLLDKSCLYPDGLDVSESGHKVEKDENPLEAPLGL